MPVYVSESAISHTNVICNRRRATTEYGISKLMMSLCVLDRAPQISLKLF